MKTWHAWFGLATMGVFFLQIAFGLATVTPALAGVFGGPAKAKSLYKYHRALGYALVASLLFTAHLGGAHSTWSLSPAVSSGARIAAFWVGLPRESHRDLDCPERRL
jgi:cytochrome b-561 domain-containing protein 2